MKNRLNIPFLLTLFIAVLFTKIGYAQPCSVATVPAYRSCFTEYFTSISAHGDMGTISAISVSASSCTGTYFDLHATQGIDAPVGANVTLNFSRFTTNYTAYVSVYVDKDNNGYYDSLEYAGGPDPYIPRDKELGPAILNDSIDVTLLCSGYPPGTYRMRVMLSERQNNVGAPCDSGNYGQVYDLYYKVHCPSTPIIGDSILCLHDTATYIAPTPCGLWNSSNGEIVYIDSNQLVHSADTTGVATISYSVAGCPSVTKTVSVVPTTPATTDQLCVGGDINLSVWPDGGLWTSSGGVSLSPSVGGCDVAGVSAGSASVSYSFDGCTTSVSLSVLSGLVLTGDSVVCIGTSDTVTSLTITGGTWSSSNSSIIATISNGAIISGTAAGTFSVTYISPGGGCTAFKDMVVIDPQITGGPTVLCAGSTGTMVGNAGGAGTWSFTGSIPGLMTLDPVTGALTTNSARAGTAMISYTLNGCVATQILTINPTPAALTMNVCQGSVIDLSLPYSPATYGSSNSYMVSITSAGLATVSMCCGMVTISRNYPSTGCWSNSVLHVNITPDIMGSTTVTCGNPVTLTAYPTGGTWSSSNASVATVSSSGVVVNGPVYGTATITYNSGVCVGTATITTIPPSMSGDAFICTGHHIELTPNFAGGVWSSSNTSVATASSGWVNGISSGSATISYALGACLLTHNVTVRTQPNLVLGVGSNPGICLESTPTSIVLDATVPGGVWTATPYLTLSVVGTYSRSVALAGSGGGVLDTKVYYAVSYPEGGCTAIYDVPVSSPSYISGPIALCVTNGGDNPTINLTASGTGPVTWSVASSPIPIATISSSGEVTGVNAGTTTISCTNASGCVSHMSINIIDLPFIRQCCGCSGHVLHVGEYATIFGLPKDEGHFITSNPSVLFANGYEFAAPEFCLSPPQMTRETNVRGVSPGDAKAFYVSSHTGCRKSIWFTVAP